MVAGVAALVLSVNPNLNSAQLTIILQTSADDLGIVGLDQQLDYGRVNAAKAVLMAFNSPPITPRGAR